MSYSIGEFSELTGLSPHALRYYEKEGLLTAARNRGGQRVYLEADLKWIEFIKKLKATGMPIKQIKIYADLRARGNETLASRLGMLKIHRQHIIDELNKWRGYLLSMDEKISYYVEEINRKK